MARDLAAILLDEGEALRSGDYSGLKALAEEREALLAGKGGGDFGDTARIRQLAARNMRLAQAAANGLRQAADRLAGITRGASLDIYSRQGKRQSFQDSRPSLHRRA